VGDTITALRLELAPCYGEMATIESTPATSAAQALELAKFISNAAESLDRACPTHGLTFPSLNQPSTPQSEAFRSNPDANEASSIIAAAAFQLVTTVMPPPASMPGAILNFRSKLIQPSILLQQ
jgi:hypothetical protein